MTLANVEPLGGKAKNMGNGKYIIETISPQEASERLRGMGMKIHPDTLRRGIDQGAFNFGVVIQCEKEPRYYIFTKKFYEWAAEVGIRSESA